ncbi:Protein translocase subunit SecY [Streptomyces griseomycini]
MAEQNPLKIHNLRPAPGAKTAKTRVGRGEASKGKTAGRGTKGTKARYQVPESFEGGQMPLHMRLPKLKGFKNPFRPPTAEYPGRANLDKLAALYPEGLISLVPTMALAGFGANQNFPFGGTSILIIVGVGLETVKQIESQLQQRNYEGFLR